MSSLTIGFLCLAATIGLIAIRVPIGLALGATSVVGLILVTNLRVTLSLIKNVPFEFSANWELSAIPMFLLMGTIAFRSGMTSSLFQAARAWMGTWPGGLAVATNFACAGFAAASGSSLATTVAMGRISVPEMRRFNYDVGLATGVVAAAGTLGSMIPPSILMVLYGIFAETSISALFIAGVLPGLLTAAIYAIMIVLRCIANPKLAPVADRPASWEEKRRTLLEVWPLPALIVGVIGSIYSGVATPTEAAAFGVVLSLVIAAAKRQLTWAVVVESFREALYSTGALFFVAIGAVLMTRLMAFSGVPTFLSNVMADWAVDPVMLVIGASFIYLILGCFLDTLGMVLLTLPVMVPMFKALDLDMVWFGILMVKYCEIGLITPPVGLCVYAVKSMNPDIPIGRIFRGIGWFLLCELFILVLLISFPQISLFLPSLMRG